MSTDAPILKRRNESVNYAAVARPVIIAPLGFLTRLHDAAGVFIRIRSISSPPLAR